MTGYPRWGLLAVAALTLLTALMTALAQGTATAATGDPAHGLVVMGLPATSAPTDPGDPTVSPSATPTAPICQVAYELTIEDGDLKAKITITNTGLATINGWYLGFTLPDGQTIKKVVGATVDSRSGEITANDVGTNAIVPPGASVVIEMALAYDGRLAKPPSFTVNGHTCATA